MSLLVLQKLRMCGHLHSQLKWFYELEKRASKRQERKAKSRANWTACFLRVPLTAQAGWLCHFLSASLPLSLSLITSMRAKKNREEGERKGLVSTVMPDERKEGRFCSAAHLFFFTLLLFLLIQHVLPLILTSFPVSILLISSSNIQRIFNPSHSSPPSHVYRLPISLINTCSVSRR